MIHDGGQELWVAAGQGQDEAVAQLLQHLPADGVCPGIRLQQALEQATGAGYQAEVEGAGLQRSTLRPCPNLLRVELVCDNRTAVSEMIPTWMAHSIGIGIMRLDPPSSCASLWKRRVRRRGTSHGNGMVMVVTGGVLMAC